MIQEAVLVFTVWRIVYSLQLAFVALFELFSDVTVLPGLSRYFSEYNIIISERTDGQSCKD